MTREAKLAEAAADLLEGNPGEMPKLELMLDRRILSTKSSLEHWAALREEAPKLGPKARLALVQLLQELALR